MSINDIKPKEIKVELNGREYEILFDLNALVVLEKVYGDFNEAYKQMRTGNVAAIRALLFASIAHEDEELTLKQVGKMVTLSNLNYVSDKLAEGMAEHFPKQQKEKQGASQKE